MSITINEFIERRNNELSSYQEQLNVLDEEIKLLLEEPKVQEYLAKKKDLKQMRKNLEDKELEITKQLSKECSHPLLCVTSKYDWLYNESNKATRCVICGAEIKVFSQKNQYENKRLIAYEIIDHDYYEGRIYHSYEQVSNIEEIRDYYYKLYLKLENLQNENYADIIPNDFCIEDAVWEHFCKPKEKQKTKKIQTMYFTH